MGWTTEIQYLAGARISSLHHCDQIGSGTPPSFLSSEDWGLLPWSKVARV